MSTDEERLELAVTPEECRKTILALGRCLQDPVATEVLDVGRARMLALQLNGALSVLNEPMGVNPAGMVSALRDPREGAPAPPG